MFPFFKSEALSDWTAPISRSHSKSIHEIQKNGEVSLPSTWSDDQWTWWRRKGFKTREKRTGYRVMKRRRINRGRGGDIMLFGRVNLRDSHKWMREREGEGGWHEKGMVSIEYWHQPKNEKEVGILNMKVLIKRHEKS